MGADESVVLITGANTGIGKATAHAMAAKGLNVVLACRSEAKTRPVVDELVRETGNERVDFLRLDLADLASVRASAQEFLETDRPLRLLINNAGLAGQRGQTADGFELAFGVNHLGHFLFTTLLLDRLTQSPAARVVNVSSGNHYQAKSIDWAAVRRPTKTFVGLHEYDVSKLCNVLFTQQLAKRYDPEVLSAFAVNPGAVASDVWRRMPKPLYAVFSRIRPMKPTVEGAESSIYAALEPGLEEQSGAYIDEDCKVKPANDRATPELGAELWERSQAWVDAATSG